MISVIIPIYNVDKYLRKCIDSVRNQTYQDLEIILVDDGSPDDSAGICDEYAKRDSRIMVIHQENGGVSSARNAGIEVARGEYICFIDGDDFILPDMFEKMYHAIQKDDADMCICNFSYVNEDGEVLEGIGYHTSICDEVTDCCTILGRLNQLTCVDYVIPWNKLYKKQIFQVIRYPIGKYNEDVFVAHELIYQCKKISLISDRLYMYVQRPGSTMHSTISVKHLDEIEGYINRILFYEKQGLHKCAIEALKQIELRYSYLRENVVVRGIREEKRVLGIDRLFRRTYFSYSFNRTLKNYLKYSLPSLYFWLK